MKNLFKKWISGEVNWMEEQQVRQSAKKDAFMAEAMEGYDVFPESDHVAKIEQLNQRIAKQAKREKGLVFYLSRAAAAAVIIGVIGSFFWLQNEVTSSKIIGDNVERLEGIKPAIKEKENDNEFTAIVDSKTKNNQEQLVPNQPIVKKDSPKIEKENLQTSTSKTFTKPITKYSAPSSISKKSRQRTSLQNPPTRTNIAEIVAAEKPVISFENEGISESIPLAGEAAKKPKPTSESKIELLADEDLIEPSGASEEKENSNPTFDKNNIELLADEIIEPTIEPTSSPRFLAKNKQNKSSETAPKTKKKRSIENLNEAEPAIIPRPKGGFLRFERFLKKNRKYPKEAKEQSVEMEITLYFYINKKGRPTNFSINKKENFGFEQEAIRLLKKGPKWKPVEREASFVFVFEMEE